jgi:hypothetical protein
VNRPLAFAVACLLTAASTVVVAANRCADARGHVTYQDAACDAATTASPVDTTDAFSTRPKTIGLAPVGKGSALPTDGDGYGNAHGAWRGPAQFQVSLAGARDGSAQMVTAMVIELKSNGEVIGVIPDAGCKLSGLATQFVAEYMASVDVSMKGCRDERFNARYSGHLTAARAAREATLHLTSMQFLPPLNKARIETVEAVLKR